MQIVAMALHLCRAARPCSLLTNNMAHWLRKCSISIYRSVGFDNRKNSPFGGKNFFSDLMLTDSVFFYTMKQT